MGQYGTWVRSWASEHAKILKAPLPAAAPVRAQSGNESPVNWAMVRSKKSKQAQHKAQHYIKRKNVWGLTQLLRQFEKDIACFPCWHSSKKTSPIAVCFPCLHSATSEVWNERVATVHLDSFLFFIIEFWRCRRERPGLTRSQWAPALWHSEMDQHSVRRQFERER